MRPLLHIVSVLAAFGTMASSPALAQRCQTSTNFVVAEEARVRHQVNLNFFSVNLGWGADRFAGTFGAEVDIRRYGAGNLMYGTLVVGGFGATDRTDEEDGEDSGWGLLVEPIVGFHWTRHGLRREQELCAVQRSEQEGYLHKSHVLGVQPLLWWVAGEIFGGAHLVWEYDHYLDRKFHRSSTGRQKRVIDERYKPALRIGYLHPWGIGGGAGVTVQAGGFTADLRLGVYQLRGTSVLFGIALGWNP